MDFAQPVYFNCLIPLALTGLVLYFLARRKEAAMARLGAPGLIARLSTTVNYKGRRWRMVLWFAALLLVIVSLARPRWGSRVEYAERQGVEIMVALDVSQSMLAEDFKPNRLARAKLEVTELMDRLEGNEMGLVLFAGAAFIQFPLTSDFATARVFLEAAHPDVISRPGTAIGKAIQVAIEGFNEQRASQKVIILLTDGENLEGQVINAAEEAAEAGVIIYAIGFGSPGGEPIPLYDDQGNLIEYKRDKEGEVVLTRLDEATLQQAAITTGGRYFRAVPDGREVNLLADAIGKLQTADIESRFEVRRLERFQWFLLVAVILLTVSELIPERIERPGPAAVVPTKGASEQ